MNQSGQQTVKMIVPSVNSLAGRTSVRRLLQRFYQEKSGLKTPKFFSVSTSGTLDIQKSEGGGGFFFNPIPAIRSQPNLECFVLRLFY